MNVGATAHIISEWLSADPAAYPSIVRVRTDPTTLSCVVTSPSGATYSYVYPTNITRTSVGVFYCTHDVNVAGVWSVTLTGTGAAAAVQRKTFTVSP